MDLRQFSRRLNRAARDKGLNQTDIAHHMRIRPQTVQKWFSAKSAPARGRDGTPSRFEELATVLGVTSAWLAGYEGDDFDPANAPPVDGAGAKAIATISTHIHTLKTDQRRRLYDLRLATSHRVAEEFENLGYPVSAEDDPFVLDVDTPDGRIRIRVPSPDYAHTVDGIRINVAEETPPGTDFISVPLLDSAILLIPTIILPTNPRTILPLRVSEDGTQVFAFSSDISHLVNDFRTGTLAKRWADLSVFPPRHVSESE